MPWRRGDLAAQVEERVLAKAAEQTRAQLRNLTDRVVMRIDPEGAGDRAEERKQRRCMGIESKEADTARLWAYLPANLATAAPAAGIGSAPSATWTTGGGRIDVFVTGASDGRLYQKYWTSGSGWSSWVDLG